VLGFGRRASDIARLLEARARRHTHTLSAAGGAQGGVAEAFSGSPRTPMLASAPRSLVSRIRSLRLTATVTATRVNKGGRTGRFWTPACTHLADLYGGGQIGAPIPLASNQWARGFESLRGAPLPPR